MTTIFKHPVTDSYGDTWVNSVCRITAEKVFGITPYKLAADDNTDVYQKLTLEVDKQTPPSKVLYKVDFWSEMARRQQKCKARTFEKAGEAIFEVDFSDTEVQQKWHSEGGTHEDAIIAVCQWHFKHKVA